MPHPPAWIGYRDRVDAGRALARLLRARDRSDSIVLALPRGGVPVGKEVARALGAPLDLLVVRKLGCPGQRELAAGAIAAGGARVLNEEVAELVGPRALAEVEARERRELARRERAYRGDRPPPSLRGRDVILVDDGLATGATMRAAIAAVRAQGAARVTVAVPVAPPDTVAALALVADEVVCPATPEPFHAIGLWYEDFRQVDDDAVRALVAEGPAAAAAAGAPADDPPEAGEWLVAAAGIELGALLSPPSAEGLVIFAHGGTSSRLSRDRLVARTLERRGLGTLLFDLPADREQRDDPLEGESRIDIELLARRIVGAIDWAGAQPELARTPIGLFGAGIGAAVALRAAVARPEAVRAVISRGGRPDLAGDALLAVRAPVLFIVGEGDRETLELNRATAARLPGPSELVIVPGASHLFEEPGALEQVARLAGDWFKRFLSTPVSRSFVGEAVPPP